MIKEPSSHLESTAGEPTGTALAGRSGSTCRRTRALNFDQNVTGLRGEEEFGFNAEPFVRTGQ
jgi:hypothetical protein